MKITPEFPEKLGFLFEPHRYKVLYGGRGAAKSWGLARALLLQAAAKPLRVLCARETQQSIADSVHKLLSDQIAALGLGPYYAIRKASILGRNGSEFIFAGLRHNVGSIKSAEAVDVVWVEEAQVVSKGSWDVLIPTIRKSGSEIWVSFNPELETDDTYKRFVMSPPSSAVVQYMTWRDNPWFPAVLEAEMEHCRRNDPDSFEHVWEGCCLRTVEGAIYARELSAVDHENRSTKVPYDPTKAVHTFWDLGFGDATAIWFVQVFPYEYHIIEYLESTGQKLAWYQHELQGKGYVYNTHTLPHDARAKTLASGGKSIEEMLRGAGFRVKIAPNLSVDDGINAVRTMMPSCWFDSEKCADGLQALRHYRYGPESGGRQQRKPLHDWSSHAADAFRMFAVGVKPEAFRPEPEAQVPGWLQQSQYRPWG